MVDVLVRVERFMAKAFPCIMNLRGAVERARTMWIWHERSGPTVGTQASMETKASVGSVG